MIIIIDSQIHRKSYNTRTGLAKSQISNFFTKNFEMSWINAWFSGNRGAKS